MKQLFVRATLLMGALALLACKDSTKPRIPTTITPSPASVTFDAIGDTRVVAVTVLDQDGRAISNPAVSWVSAQSSVATVAAGTITAVSNGTTQVSAVVGNATVAIPVTVQQTATTASKPTGDLQQARVATSLPTALQVKAVDRLGHPLTNRVVTFIVEGGGSVFPTSTTTGIDGAALTSWTLGTNASAAQRVTATIENVASPVTFTATALAGPPTLIAISSGNSQTAVVGSAVAVAPSVRVSDVFDNPIQGLSVTFSTFTGNGTVSGSGVTTNAQGIATATTWTLGQTAGVQSVVASTPGLSPVTITATAIAGPAASLTITSLSSQSASAGTAVVSRPAVRVNDSFGNPVANVPVAFTVLSGGGSVGGSPATSGANGVATVGAWTLGPATGTQTLSAAATGLSPVTFTATATGVVASIAVSAGNNQTAFTGALVPIAPAVIVRDAQSNPVAGVSVTFAVSSGGGVVTGAAATTNASGIATVGSWAMGIIAGTNTLSATVAGNFVTGNPVTFTATATSNTSAFDIDLRFLTSATPAQTAAFTSAAAKWKRVIIGDLANVALNAGAGSCGSGSPAINETVDDVLILVTLEPIDGPGKILGSAGPCFVRNSNSLTILGTMRFDTADLASMEANGTLNEVILHEMGHVLGIGTLWTDFNLLVNPSLPSSLGADTKFIGAGAIAGFNEIGGTTYTLGGKVPVENTQGGAGTRDAHWRESVLQNELMTGFIGAAGNPLSILTVRSLADLGYTVNPAAADPFFLTLSLQAGPPTVPAPVRLLDDVLQLPIYRVDNNGLIKAVVRRP